MTLAEEIAIAVKAEQIKNRVKVIAMQKNSNTNWFKIGVGGVLAVSIACYTAFKPGFNFKHDWPQLLIAGLTGLYTFLQHPDQSPASE